MATIVIAGASRGIGFTLARLYAEAGDRVYALCRNPAGADALNALASFSEGRVTVGKVDFGDGASIDKFAEELGDSPVDLLLNVGGIFIGETGPEDRNFDGWRESFEVMCIGPFRMVQALLPNLERAGGKALTVSSQLAASPWPYGGMYSYSAAKAGLNRVMRALSIDVKERGIAVCTVHPGYVQTDMGGPDADITALESASGIRDVAARMTLDNSGTFWKWNGDVHPW
jgi:NAD(P)-dependent dehydrogenase (short-subunit alcohol dehydrogenase family)